jgi:hypothetical protein
VRSLERQIREGRSTPGPVLPNDRAIDYTARPETYLLPRP